MAAKRDRDGITQSGVSEDRNGLADHRLLDLTPGPASRGPSLSCEEEDAQPHARCIFLNAFNNPLNIDFYAHFCHSPPVEAHAFGWSLSASARMAKTMSYELSASTDDFRKVTGVLYV